MPRSNALGRVDFEDPVVAADEKELFDFMHAVAMDHDPAVFLAGARLLSVELPRFASHSHV